jgi:Calcineurin-like phosphoesterase
MTAARSRLLSRRRAIAAAAVLLVAAALVVSRPPQGEAATVFSFGVAGDFGANSNTSSVLNAVPASGANAFFALGDFSYNEVTPESAWCNFVKSRVGSSYPFELLAGNHEDDGPDGLIANYAACLPDRLGVQDDYPREYYVDYPAGNPLVRFVMISPQLTFPPSTWSYAKGTAHYNWTVTAIDGARSAGIPWVVVGMHKYCLSLVNFPCGTGTDIMNLLVSKKVDLYLQAHDHAYSRTKQLALNGSCTAIPTGSFNPNCVADGNPASAYTAGNGTVLATVGSGGRPINAEHPELPQGPFFQAWMGSNFNATWGFLKVDVSDTQLRRLVHDQQERAATANIDPHDGSDDRDDGAGWWGDGDGQRRLVRPERRAHRRPRRRHLVVRGQLPNQDDLPQVRHLGPGRPDADRGHPAGHHHVVHQLGVTGYPGRAPGLRQQLDRVGADLQHQSRGRGGEPGKRLRHRVQHHLLDPPERKPAAVADRRPADPGAGLHRRHRRRLLRQLPRGNHQPAPAGADRPVAACHAPRRRVRGLGAMNAGSGDPERGRFAPFQYKVCSDPI